MDLIESRQDNPNRHPWEIARARRALSLLPGRISGGAADIGSGDLYFARLLAGRSDMPVTAVDSNYSSSGRDGGIVLSRDIGELPAGGFGLATLMDVLEHVEDDAGFLRRTMSLLRPGGCLLITVPAHQYLFSEHDVFLKHHRRYGRADLLRLVSGAGLEVREIFYFFFIAYCVRALQVALGKLGVRGKMDAGAGAWPYPAGHAATRLLTLLLEWDFIAGRTLARVGIRMPGLSLCAVCFRRA